MSLNNNNNNNNNNNSNTKHVNRKYKSNRSPPPLQSPPPTPPFSSAAASAHAAGNGDEFYYKKSKLNAINVVNTASHYHQHHQNNSNNFYQRGDAYKSGPHSSNYTNGNFSSSSNRHQSKSSPSSSSSSNYKNRHYHANNRYYYRKHDHYYHPHNCKYHHYNKNKAASAASNGRGYYVQTDKRSTFPFADNHALAQAHHHHHIDPSSAYASSHMTAAVAVAASAPMPTSVFKNNSSSNNIGDSSDLCLSSSLAADRASPGVEMVPGSPVRTPPPPATTTRDYSTLPSVVLTKIFSYLNFHDRLQAFQTCKRWRTGLFDPCLWQHKYNLVIYLCNRQQDLESAYFKMSTFGKHAQSCSIKYNPNDAYLFHEVANLLELLLAKSSENNNAVGAAALQSPNYLKRLSLEPIYSYYFDYDSPHHPSHPASTSKHYSIEKSNRRIFKALRELIGNSKCFEHLALGCLTDLGRADNNLLELLNEMQQSHDANLKSLHISSIRNASSLSLSSRAIGQQSSASRMEESFSSLLPSPRTADSFLRSFSSLCSLSIDLDDLNDQLLLLVGGTTLKKLAINVNSIEYEERGGHHQGMENNNNNNQPLHVKDETWAVVREKSPELRVKVNFLMIQNAFNKYKYVLNTTMPLETLRMYFCKSLNPSMLQYLSDNYSDSLHSLCIVDSMIESNLRYHNPLRYDTDPDPLVLLCWKCRNLSKLVLVGYEILKINLIAIAKLRSNLSLFYVPMDCIIDLTYGKFKDDDFIEDEDGEDTIVDYRACSNHVINKVCSILKCPNWHPLERDELPMCVYDQNISIEESFLDTLIHDQNQNNSNF